MVEIEDLTISFSISMNLHWPQYQGNRHYVLAYTHYRGVHLPKCSCFSVTNIPQCYTMHLLFKVNAYIDELYDCKSTWYIVSEFLEKMFKIAIFTEKLSSNIIIWAIFVVCQNISFLCVGLLKFIQRILNSYEEMSVYSSQNRWILLYG